MNGALRGKALPSRPSQDTGYMNATANGYRDDYDRDIRPARPQIDPRIPTQDPTGRSILEGYRQDIVTGFETEKPRYNPLNTSRPQSSPLLNVNDEIQVHLLVETALGDSKEYEILSQEEVDDLKRQVQSLSSRIDQTRQTLAIQSKYRDAALNISKLYSNTNRSSGEGADGKKRRSLLGHNRTPSHEVREADHERQASERRCDELAAELWSLEKRLMVPQNRLLKHTAGILQMTHKGPATPKAQKASQQGGIPGSPESMYTYQNSRNSTDFVSEDDLFDERSLYQNADSIWDDVVKEVSPVGPSKEQLQMIASTEQKLEDLNSRLREILIKANPQRELAFPPRKNVGGVNAAEALQDHLDYLEQNIGTIGEEHNELVRGKQESGAALGNMEQTETVMMGLWDIIQSGEEEERQRKRDRRQTRTAQNLPDEDDSPVEDSDPNETFSMQAFSAKVQWLYTQATRLKEQKKVLQRQIKQQRELNSKSDATKDAELAQKTEELTRTAALLTRTERDGDEVRMQLAAVMEKLDEARQQERMREQSQSTDEAAAVRQIQDELNKRIDLNARLEEQLQDLKDDQAIAEAETRSKVADAESKVASLTKDLAAAVAARAALDSAIQDRDQKMVNSQQEKTQAQQAIAQLERDLAAKDSTIATQTSQLTTLTEKSKTAEQELEEMNIQVAQLRTEVTIARAELDGAYGSRAQRAAEAAPSSAVQQELSELQLKNVNLLAEMAELREKSSKGSEAEEKNKILRKELEEMLGEYTDMTKAGIEWERERYNLEKEVDTLREEREALESQLSDERVGNLGMRSPGLEGGSAGVGGGNTSAMVLRNEFKKMMRDSRTESQKALRAEQELRRKAEEDLRALKKQYGPGKSNLSQKFGFS